MRTIKFRALKDDMSNCNWVYGCIVYDAAGAPRITEVDKSGEGLTFHTCLKDTECQFTGLTDKNGAGVYEGDIVTMSSGIFKNTPMRVLFCEILLCYVLTFDGMSKSKELKVTSTKRLTVIGNIHQHLELLK